MPPTGELIDNLRNAITAVCEADPHQLGDGQTVQDLLRELNRLDAGATRAVAAFDASQNWAADGALNASAWLSAKCRLFGGSAHRRVRLGRDLRHMAHTEAAWLAGEITADHVARLARTRTSRTDAAFDEAEDELVRWAKELSFRRFARALGIWAQVADPDGAEDQADKDREGRRLSMSQSWHDNWFFDAQGDAISGTIVADELRRLADQLFDDDWKEARARLGREPTTRDLRRTGEQRRWDALVEMAIRSRTAPKHGRRPEPLFVALVDYPTLAGRVCQLANGTVVTPGSIAPFLTTADIERVVFDSPKRVIDVGVRRRLFEGATRRAVEVRDQECFHPLCEIPADQCEIDHIEPYGFGGLTVQDNGRAACAKHNRLRNQRRRE